MTPRRTGRRERYRPIDFQEFNAHCDAALARRGLETLNMRDLIDRSCRKALQQRDNTPPAPPNGVSEIALHSGVSDRDEETDLFDGLESGETHALHLPETFALDDF